MNEVTQQLQRSEGYLAIDPDNQELLARVIDLSLAAADLPRANGHAQAALRRYPDDPWFQARLGQIHLAQQDWTGAEAVFASLFSRHQDINLAYNLAYALQRQGRHAEAVGVMAPYEQASELSSAMLTLIVRSLHHMGEGDRALALAEPQLARCGNDAELLSALSLICFDADRLEQAEQLSAAAMALLPTADAAPLEALVTSGSLALARVDSDAAIARFQQVLQRNPAEGRSWSGLGTASLLKRDLAAAQQQLEQALKFMPGHIGTWHLLGWARIFARQLDGARAAFAQALSLDRNFGESHGGLAVVAALQGQRDEAQAEIDRALGLDRDSLAARYAQMILGGQTEDPVRFRALAQRLLSSRAAPFGRTAGELLERYEAS
ncbi:tetratricopeptide repeat protein [Duganella sp. FT80W]|uniref:Tetratricopeptide repeat protein n=1 Tax=Duganella guangzhouensis TaxID=2666084 RepID=A0A6I2LBQ7_9BURK|nr:tetratricopeptide repeat protein [Duganella guangzhouensis]MRW94186.1 tetratricopeptide repeat protein [Duganella guangzhouensis]